MDAREVAPVFAYKGQRTATGTTIMKRLPLAFLLLALSVLLGGCPSQDDDNRIGADDQPLQTGLQSISSGGEERTYYLELPSDYAESAEPKPLIIAYHGTGQSHEGWLNGYYSLKESVGDGAILIYPDALFNEAAGYTQWDEAKDSAMFEDLLATLPATLRFDPDRIFITGHSSGAGFADVIGCRYGDRIRAIAPVVGTLTNFTCTGSVAVMNIVGSKDPLADIARFAHRYWVRYNGLEVATTAPGAVAPCVDHGLGSLDYPVLLCVHDEGDGPTEDNPVSTAHDWPSFAGDAIWTFFSSLNRLAPRSEPPPGGGNEGALGNFDTSLSITLRYPESIPRPLQGAVVLFPAGSVPPSATQQPLAFLNLNLPLGDEGAGSEKSYQVPIRYVPFGGPVDFPGSYVVGVFIYVEGGSFPQPAPGVDHAAYAPVELVDSTTAIVIPDTLTLAPFETAP
jgi:poly(3-hydroxybutyrate) depolymerase